jgi:hypothetical protein
MPKKLLNWFFETPKEPLTGFRIILWWEKRRIPFNLMVALVGISSMALSDWFHDAVGHLHHDHSGGPPFEALLMPLGINFGYTLGWLSESSIAKGWRSTAPERSPMLLKRGLLFSIFIVSLPAVSWFFTWSFQVVF